MIVSLLQIGGRRRTGCAAAPVAWIMASALVLVPSIAAADDTFHARFEVADATESNGVVVRQGGREVRCPAPVQLGRPCTILVDRGPAEVEIAGDHRRTFEFVYSADTRHRLEYRSTWPRWVGTIATAVGAVGLLFGLGESCSDSDAIKQASCESSRGGLLIVGTGALLVGVPLLIYGIAATGDRTEHEALMDVEARARRTHSGLVF